MKPTAFLLSLLLILPFCTGCRADPPEAKTAGELLGQPFVAEAAVEWGEERYDAILTRGAGDMLRLELSGETLPSPVAFCRAEGGLTLELSGLSLRLPYEDAPAGGLVTTLGRALEQLEAAPLVLEGETLVATAGEARLTLDPKSGLPGLLELGRGQLTFSRFEPTDLPDDAAR